MMFHLADIDCLLRAPTLEKTLLYRYLEDGAAGLMIPPCLHSQKARELVQALKFPPLGDRGLDGAGLDCDYIIQGGESYPDEANAETFLVVQIETVEAVLNVDEIAAVPGVDALLSARRSGLRLKKTPHDRLTMEDCVARVGRSGEKTWKSLGTTRLQPRPSQTVDRTGSKVAQLRR